MRSLRGLGNPAGAIGPEAQAPRRPRAAAVSIVSNSALIALKLAAGAITGSIAIITEALHSAIDLMASVVAYISLRKAEEPADESHLYGHEKAENVAAGIEGMLILVGAGVIVYEAARRLVDPAPLQALAIGIAVLALSMAVNLLVARYLRRQASRTDSAALEADAAHLRTDAATSFGVLVGLALVEMTGLELLDPAIALLVAGAIVFAGIRILTRSSRVLMDEALPAGELALIREVVTRHGASEVVGFHKLRARRAGSRRYVDMHVQFAEGTSLARAHEVSHELQAAISEQMPRTDVLIHLEPGPERVPGGASAG